MGDPEEGDNSRLNQMATPPTLHKTGGAQTETQVKHPEREEEKTQLLVKNTDPEVQR